ncbi:MAG: raffinose/stachyose/melibiose transport system permease protein [Actinomycetota bacterium]|nr:raffinose/stachyose/melibiose transport system permease protein [Actinomycetota bacterium]
MSTTMKDRRPPSGGQHVSRGTKNKVRGPRDPFQPVAYLIAIVISSVTIVPLLYVIIGGFRTTASINENPVGLPSPWNWQNYTSVLQNPTFWRMVFNSTLIASLTVAFTVIAGAMAAFVLSRIDFKGREVIFTLFTLGLLFPASVALLPLFIMIRNFGLLDNPLGVALPQAAFALPTTIVILRPFMGAIPAELEDSAVMDGCTRLGFFWRILLPLARPALLTVSVLAFVSSWNAFILPLVVLTDSSQLTLPLGVSQFSQQYTADTARALGFTALSMLPALVFFSLAERRIVGGLSGAVKG